MQNQTPNPQTQRRAILDAIAWSEGTDKPGQPTKNKGYDVIVGGSLFTDYSKHPNKLVDLPRLRIKSTAAGRYQLLYRYWVAYAKLLKLPDFSPASQDAIALQQIRERKALDDIDAGNLRAAVKKIRNIWASLPGAGYGQNEHTYDNFEAAFKRAGGVVADK